jgi:hemin uptake protein HemP
MDTSSRSARPDFAAPSVASAALAAAGVSQRLGANGARRVTSDSLLEGGEELLIEHRGSQYRLRLTALGKLILTK